MKILKGFKEARKASKKSDLKSAKVGACAVNGKRIFKGYNTKKTHTKLPELYGNTLSTHAEAKAIFNSKRNPIHTIYVYREDSKGDIKNSRPCEGCLGFLIAKGVKRIFYTLDNNSYGQISTDQIMFETIHSWNILLKEELIVKKFLQGS